MFKRLIGITGLILTVSGLYLLWISPDTELSEVIRRTRCAIVLDISGGLMMVFSIYRR